MTPLECLEFYNEDPRPEIIMIADALERTGIDAIIRIRYFKKEPTFLVTVAMTPDERRCFEPVMNLLREIDGRPAIS